MERMVKCNPRVTRGVDAGEVERGYDVALLGRVDTSRRVFFSATRWRGRDDRGEVIPCVPWRLRLWQEALCAHASYTRAQIPRNPKAAQVRYKTVHTDASLGRLCGLRLRTCRCSVSVGQTYWGSERAWLDAESADYTLTRVSTTSNDEFANKDLLCK